MLHLYCILAVVIPMFVIGGICELIAIALGFLDPWDYR